MSQREKREEREEEREGSDESDEEDRQHHGPRGIVRPGGEVRNEQRGERDKDRGNRNPEPYPLLTKRVHRWRKYSKAGGEVRDRGPGVWY